MRAASHLQLDSAFDHISVAALALSGIWGSISGDFLLPSMVGAGAAAYIRAQSPSEKLDGVDLVIFLCVSVGIGMVIARYVASQIPQGDGSVAMGALIGSFIGVAALTKLHRLDWNIPDFLKESGKALGKRKKKSDES